MDDSKQIINSEQFDRLVQNKITRKEGFEHELSGAVGFGLSTTVIGTIAGLLTYDFFNETNPENIGPYLVGGLGVMATISLIGTIGRVYSSCVDFASYNKVRLLESNIREQAAGQSSLEESLTGGEVSETESENFSFYK